jgi:hypothetical protein
MLIKFKRTKSKDLIINKFTGILQACCKVFLEANWSYACILDHSDFGDLQ